MVEKELLILASKGCEESFAKIFTLYKDRLFRFILRITRSEEQSLDFVQDIFMKLWINRSSLARVDNFSAYLFRSAQNQALNVFKRLMNETAILSEMQAGDDSDNDIVSNFEYKILETKFRSVVKKLPPQQRLVYTLSREQGLKYDDIAQRLHISSATVKNHMIQALKTIREFVKNDLDRVEFH